MVAENDSQRRVIKNWSVLTRSRRKYCTVITTLYIFDRILTILSRAR